MLETQEKYSSKSNSGRGWGYAHSGEVACSIISETEGAPGRVTTTHGDVNFINVSGTLVQMAAQLGQRMAPQIHQGAVPFFATYLENVLSRAPVHKLAPLLRWTAHKWVTDRLIKNLPEPFIEAIHVMADETGLQPGTLFKAYLMPETFLWVLGAYHRAIRSPRAPGLGSTPLFGCTSAVTLPPASASTLHGRNFDYFGVGYWDREATVVFYHPDDGLDYVSVSSAGFLGGGITSMNAAGLTFVVHQHFIDKLDLNGVPVGVAGDIAMRHAHSIEEAINILREFPPVGGWTYIFTEGDTGKAAVYEVSPGKEALHWIAPDQTQFGYANVYWAPQFKSTEVDYYPEYRRCNYARQKRVLECLREQSAQTAILGVEHMADVLGDLREPETGRERLFGPTIAGAHTVASVVFEPAQRRVWVGTGRSPSSRRWFVPFKLSEKYDGAPDRSVLPFTGCHSWQDTAQGRAFDIYRQAAHKFWEGESDEQLLIMIEYALALYPEEPNLHILAGLLALRINRGKRAEGAFRRALEMLTDPARSMEVVLFLGWALDLQRQRTAAKHLYLKVSNDRSADAITIKRARHSKWRIFTSEHAQNLHLDFIYAGVS